LESSLKTARRRRAVFRLQSREFAPEGRELSALKLILRIAVFSWGEVHMDEVLHPMKMLYKALSAKTKNPLIVVVFRG